MSVLTWETLWWWCHSWIWLSFKCYTHSRLVSSLEIIGDRRSDEKPWDCSSRVVVMIIAIRMQTWEDVQIQSKCKQNVNVRTLLLWLVFHVFELVFTFSPFMFSCMFLSCSRMLVMSFFTSHLQSEQDDDKGKDGFPELEQEIDRTCTLGFLFHATCLALLYLFLHLWLGICVMMMVTGRKKLIFQVEWNLEGEKTMALYSTECYISIYFYALHLL